MKSTSAIKAAAECHALIRNVTNRILDIQDTLPEEALGAVVRLQHLCDKHMRCTRRHCEAGEPRRIGVFGPPKRGKSTLVNALLGVHLLPTAKCPKTATAVEIHAAETWSVSVMENSGYSQSIPFSNVDGPRTILEERAGHDPDCGRHSLARSITIRGPFPSSKIFSHDATLIDTPGAEAAFAFARKPTGNETKSDLDIREDTTRALEMLASTDIVLFLMRADHLHAANDRDFHAQYLKKLNPINVVNFLDVWEQEENDGKNVRKCACDAYGLDHHRTYAVSAKWAQDTKKREDSRIETLESVILRELEQFTPEKAIPYCLEEMHRALSVIRNSRKAAIAITPESADVACLAFTLEQCQSWGVPIRKRIVEFSKEWDSWKRGGKR